MEAKGLLSNYYTWILVLSVIGGILFLTTEFAGYTAPPYYYWYSVSFASAFENPDHVVAIPVILAGAAMFLFNALIALKELNIFKVKIPYGDKRFGLYI
ncbi:MAG: hypothetical protein ACTSVM_01495 [Candidatus Ranarchaeia archaeon]